MAVDRTRLPKPAADPLFTFPQIRRRTLANGVNVWTAEHRDVGLISTLVLVRAGAAYDPPDRPGLAAITGDLLDEGCGDLDALALHDTIGRLGAQLDTEVGSDATVLGLTTLTRFAAPGLALLADMIAIPRLEERDFDRVRDLRLNRLRQMHDVPQAVAERVFISNIYGSHPYGHLPIGSEESLREMQAGEAAHFHRQLYDPSRVTVIAVGDATHDELAALIEGAFAGWRPVEPARPYPDPAAAPAPARPGDRLILVPRDGAAQSELRVGHVGVARTSPDYHALIALNLVLGGQFVSRINLNLRERKGYTYGARTAFDFRRSAGPFVLHASVQSNATADAVREVFVEFSAIRGERPVTSDELELGRAPLTRGYARGFETAEQVARAIAQIELYDLPQNYFTEFVPKVLSLTPEDLTRAAATHIDPDRLLTVIVGDPEVIGDSLRQLNLGEPRVIEPVRT
jgi:predicted Zn-dependent peptidase